MLRPLPDPLPELITAKMWEGKRVAPIDPATGRKINRVAAVNTKEGWIEQYELADGATEDHHVARVKIVAGGLAPPVRRQADFDLVDRATGVTVARVRGLTP